jgi:quinol monooxygenase YgiN
MYFLVQFESLPGKASEFREALLRVLEPTRAEPGCVSIRVFESLHEPVTFGIHSEWVDEAAFEEHSRMPHTVEFVSAGEKRLAHPIHGLRAQEIDSDDHQR